MILKLTAILLAATAVDLAMRKTSAALRHLMWCVALACALLLPAGEFFAERAASPHFVIHANAVAAPLALFAPARVPWLFALYGTGVALLLFRLLRDVLEANRLQRQSRLAFIPGLRFQIGISAVGISAVAISDEALVPFAWSTVVVPPEFETWEEERQRSVVAHEAAHIARGDRWTTLLAGFACAVYWFHPLVWWAAAKIRREADHACDDAVLREGFSGQGYASTLIHIARTLRPNALAPQAVTASQLEQRVRHILSSNRNRRNPGLLGIAALLAASLAIAFAVLTISMQGTAVLTRPSVLKKVDPAYTKEASARKLSGTVRLSLVVGADGSARNIEVTRTLDPGLDANAVRAVQQWKFKPGTKSGRPVDVKATIEVNYRLL